MDQQMKLAFQSSASLQTISVIYNQGLKPWILAEGQQGRTVSTFNNYTIIPMTNK